MLKCAESEADTQQHLHKRSAEAVVVGQTSMGAHFLHSYTMEKSFLLNGGSWCIIEIWKDAERYSY